ncbi:zinc-ribbon domain-containing protein [Anaerofustis sp. NSJ-163]|uniref:zinc-ribbon domain-containing protein n=1 Tax=Anaerofustis sp. NSJ-163 TaxID=2944391 RepID=UPI00209C4CD5|nr:zinc-ribbon domain-containing protein [Anaerofustis sp. NSJ-163]MCO8193218.1 zinc-ribbon domain-containing protein [Anaerofustis sp. NSJ-163]
MICPRCGFENSNDSVFCSECGFNLREENLDLLEKDPVLIVLNNKYVRSGIVRFVSGCVLAASFFLMYAALEYNLPDSIGITGMLLILPSLVVFIISCILRGLQRKKIIKELNKHKLNNIK